ncbi:MAG: type II secretion system protein [Planctomycetota bacterium]
MRRAGFTLVELLVVMAVIAVLASLMFPALQHVRAQANATRCRSNLKSIGTALSLYLNRNDYVLPVVAAMPSLRLNNHPRIVNVLAPHCEDPAVFRCPADTKGYRRTEGSSYQFNTHLNGRKLGASFLARRLGESSLFLMFDYEPFHGEPGEPGAANYLFADGHVGDLE